MKYDIFEIPDPKHPGKKIQHLRIVRARRMSKDSFLKFMHDRTALTPGAITSVMQGLSEVLAWSLADGYTISIDDLGTFSLQIQKNDRTEVEDLTHIHAMSVDVKGVTFLPSKRFMTEITKKAKFVRAEEDVKSVKWSDGELEQAIRDYLASHKTMTRHSFQQYAQLSASTASRRIRQFVESGLIVNIGTAYNPIYILASSNE